MNGCHATRGETLGAVRLKTKFLKQNISLFRHQGAINILTGEKNQYEGIFHYLADNSRRRYLPRKHAEQIPSKTVFKNRRKVNRNPFFLGESNSVQPLQYQNIIVGGGKLIE